MIFIKGGGFLLGCNGQEDTLMRSGGLYPILKKFEKDYYQFHRRHCKSVLYSHSVIYAPNVPFFRDDNGCLLPKPYCCSIISSSAVNAKYFLRKHRGHNNEWLVETKKIIYDTMQYRIDKILDIAVRYKHDAIILGPFGCDHFGNDPNIVADIFAQLLATKYRLRFKTVRFAILEFSKQDKVFDAFHYAIKRRFVMS